MSVITAIALGWYYLRVPTAMGIGQYTLKADLPTSGGLYKTANVTYRGETIGRVTAVEPTETGVQATMSIGDRYKIPVDASANVHSVSAVGEQYLDLVSEGNPGKYFSPGQTITKATVPAEIGPALDAANRGLAVLPKEKISQLLDETAQAVGGLGPALQRLVDSTQAIAGDFKTNISDINDIIENSGTDLGQPGRLERSDQALVAQPEYPCRADCAERPARAKHPEPRRHRPRIRSTRCSATSASRFRRHWRISRSCSRCSSATTRASSNCWCSCRKTSRTAQMATAAFPGYAALDNALTINQPPPCMTGFLPASQWRSPADTSLAPLPSGTYCKIPQDAPANAVRGARNIPCVDVPGKRAATPRECRDPKPYVPLGTNPWYGDPNQIRNCPAPGARCDQPVDPGHVIPGAVGQQRPEPTARRQAAARRATPPPISDPLQRPGSGTVECNGQQPNPCVYVPGGPPAAVYSPQSGELAGPDGAKYAVDNSSKTGDDGWKDMLAPAS